jgi:hypothetical protein
VVKAIKDVAPGAPGELQDVRTRVFAKLKEFCTKALGFTDEMLPNKIGWKKISESREQEGGAAAETPAEGGGAVTST